MMKVIILIIAFFLSVSAAHGSDTSVVAPKPHEVSKHIFKISPLQSIWPVNSAI